jgi:prophage DNA circulation protein
MSWTDRIKEAAYTSPSGERFIFTYEDVSKTVEKKTAAFEFPDADGTYIQDLGQSGRRYPLRVIFWGADYDQQSDAFEAALLEQGTGKLEHPIYETVNVVPFGAISRRDDLKTAANQAIIEVTFWETIELLYPAAQTDPASSVLSSVEEYNTAVSEEFEQLINLDRASDQAVFANDYQLLLNNASSSLQAIADTQDNVSQQFNAIVQSINQGITILIGDPLTLAFQTTQLIQAPARALTNIEARIDAYRNLTNSLVTGDDKVAIEDFSGSTKSNEFHAKALYAFTSITGSVISVVNNKFTTKTEALQAAEFILTQLDIVNDWREINFSSLFQVDTGNSYQQLQKTVALTAGFLVQISFTLKQERRIILDRPRTIIDLAGQLYGSIDDQLDFLINSNNLSGSEILELPRGREIVYYT